MKVNEGQLGKNQRTVFLSMKRLYHLMDEIHGKHIMLRNAYFLAKRQFSKHLFLLTTNSIELWINCDTRYIPFLSESGRTPLNYTCFSFGTFSEFTWFNILTKSFTSLRLYNDNDKCLAYVLWLLIGTTINQHNSTIK